MASKVELWLGPPGTGKTTALLDRVEQEIKKGVPLERIAFLSFSRRAVAEALERAGATREQAPNFRTIHSLGYHLCGLTPTQVVRPHHLWEFGQEIEEVFSTARKDRTKGSEDEPDTTVTSVRASLTRGDLLLSLYSKSRARNVRIEDIWKEAAPLVNINLPSVLRFQRQYESWKERKDLYDFSDMISLAQGQLDADVVIVDEAQDTTSTQWTLLRNATPTDARVVIAGDDDQAIYSWAGADVGFLQRVEAETRVLPHSYRLTRSVKRLADRVGGRIGKRLPKHYTSRQEEGEVEFARDVVSCDLRKGKWLLLARTRAQLSRWVWVCRMQGVVYQYSHATIRSGQEEHWSWQDDAVTAARTYHRLTRGRGVPRADARTMIPYTMSPREMEERSKEWPETVTWETVFPVWKPDRTWMEALPNMNPQDMEYVRELRKNGESLSRPGRIRISTIHHAKGSESPNVGLLTSLTPRVQKGVLHNPDDELRVQYVAATRALDRLVLVRGGSRHQYQF